MLLVICTNVRLGYTVFPDPYAENVGKWWTESFQKFFQELPFDSIWLDMTEPASFASGSLNGLGPLDRYEPAAVSMWPEGYDNITSGNSGNITVDGKLTYMQQPEEQKPSRREMLSRRMGTLETVDNDLEKLTFPPYQIHNGAPNEFNELGHKTVAANATHANGYYEYDVHNANGHMIAKHTRDALDTIFEGNRSMIIARSNFAGSGRFTQHWLGDNYSTWQSMRDSIKGLFQFSAFQMPFVGADACGFSGNTDEELCTRWMMLASLTPFFRNHNVVSTYQRILISLTICSMAAFRKSHTDGLQLKRQRRRQSILVINCYHTSTAISINSQLMEHHSLDHYSMNSQQTTNSLTGTLSS